jgi:SAM-dependent methyltransferase
MPGSGGEQRTVVGSWFRHRGECPVCQGTGARRLLELPYDRGPVYRYLKRYYEEKGRFEGEYLEGAVYRVVECARCGLLYQEFVPTDALLDRVYGVWIDPVAAAARSEAPRGARVLNLVAELALLYHWRRGARLKVLDYGMGHGHWCAMAKLFGHEVHGFEVEDTRNQNAENRLGIRVVRYDEIPAGGYDYINSTSVFEHLPEPLAILKHLSAGLKPGGIVRLAVPDGRRIRRLLGTRDPVFTKGHPRSLNDIVPLQHLNCFRARSLRQLGLAAGLVPCRPPLRPVIAARQRWHFPVGFVKNLGQPLRNTLVDQGTMLHGGGLSLYFVRPKQ